MTNELARKNNAGFELQQREVTPQSWAMIEQMGEVLRRNPYTKRVLFCYEHNLPLSAADSLYVVGNRIGMQSDLVARQVRAHPDYDYRVKEINEKVCEIEILQKHGGESKVIGSVRWTIGMAERAGLAEKDVWQKYPEDMLFGKAMTRAQRRYAPEALSVPAFTQDELETFEGIELPKLEAPKETNNKEAPTQEQQIIAKHGFEDGPKIIGLIRKGLSLEDAEAQVLQLDIVDGETRELTPYEKLLDAAHKEGHTDADLMRVNEGEMPQTEDVLAIAIEKLEGGGF